MAKPFKGQYYYEWEPIKGIVFHWLHDLNHKPRKARTDNRKILQVWRLGIWNLRGVK